MATPANIIPVPKPSRAAYNPNRPLSRNTLVQAQVRHFAEADKNLPPELQTGMDIASIITEGEASGLHPESNRSHSQKRWARRESSACRVRRAAALAFFFCSIAARLPAQESRFGAEFRHEGRTSIRIASIPRARCSAPSPVARSFCSRIRRCILRWEAWLRRTVSAWAWRFRSTTRRTKTGVCSGTSTRWRRRTSHGARAPI